MSKRNERLLIADMRDAVSSILSYTDSLTVDSFASDKKTVDAVLRNLTVLGEAANRLPQDIYKKYPQIEWEKIVRSRHIIVHDYFGVDITIVWKIVTDYLPPLLEKLDQLLSEEI